MKPKDYFVIDLFAGCGGLSEGFKQCGFKVISQIEMDEYACETLRTRQLYYLLKEKNRRYVYDKYLRGEISKNNVLAKYSDIKKIIKKRIINSTLKTETIDIILQRVKESVFFHNATNFHVLLGGPPCQPYSIAGRSRDPQRMEYDNRHYLYKFYLHILEELKPDFFVYENVPGLFSAKAKGKRIFMKILKDFSNLNPSYEITPPLEKVHDDPNSYILNSKNFFIPQKRKRLFLIGYKKTLKNKDVRIKQIFYLLQKKSEINERKGFLTVDDAIGDLPALSPGKGNDYWYKEYSKSKNLKSYQIKMRRGSPGILNHKARTHMESDIERYKFFIEHHKNGNGSATLNNLKRERPDLLPNHRHLDKFIDRFKVQWWNQPSSTITAHIRKDGHYYIHPDIYQCRSFSVREAARCQSFPDNYFFEGPRTSQFKQVGNAVPPLLGKEIAKVIKKSLDSIYNNQL